MFGSLTRDAQGHLPRARGLPLITQAEQSYLLSDPIGNPSLTPLPPSQEDRQREDRQIGPVKTHVASDKAAKGSDGESGAEATWV